VGKIAALKTSAPASSFSRDRAGWISATFYLAIVLILWTPFSLHSGMPYETGFVYTSEISTWWNGFVFGADLSRMHTSTFFQVGYLLGELTGFRGSFVPYQIVYAALWWARGFLLFLIVRQLLPGQAPFAYLAGGLALVQSSDLATAWVGQMPQLAYIFWMLAAFYLLVRGFDSRSRLWLAAAIFCEYMSLWTYESPIVIILIAPLLLVWLRRDAVRKHVAALWAWYAVPVIYLSVLAIRYMRSAGHTYQESVLRKNWGISSILHDWAFNIFASLKFWGWASEQPARAPEIQLALLAALAVLMLLGGMAALAKAKRPAVRELSGTLAVGFLLIVFSFPAYLLLDSARSLWRTQMLSGPGAALTLSAVTFLCASVAPVRWLRFGLLASLSGWIAWCGSYSALAKSSNHRWLWDRHKFAMEAVLDAAPKVKPGTLIILTNVPEGDADPFAGDNTWFDMALRLAYPGTAVAGAYWHSGGSPARGARPVLSEDNAESILVLEYSKNGRASVARHLPQFLGLDERAAALYNPATRIESGPPSEWAVRRYGFQQLAQ
jgi:hypothetical protein